MAVAWSGIFILFVVFLRLSKAGMLCYNVSFLSVILVGCIFRCILPLDFPGFTQPISSTSVLAQLDKLLLTPSVPVGDSRPPLAPMTVFFIVWAVGTVIGLLIVLIQYIHLFRKEKRFALVDRDLAYRIVEEHPEASKLKMVRISEDESVITPFVYGFRYLHIVMPTLPTTNGEMRLVVSHEATHWFNGDMWVRLLTQLICCLFWWNPFVYLLYINMEQTLELKCDLKVIDYLHLDGEKQKEYLSVLEKFAKYAQEMKKKKKGFFKRLFSRSSLSSQFLNYAQLKALQERLEVIGTYRPNKKKERRIATFTAAIMVVLMIFSYRYILQPYFDMPDNEISSGTLENNDTASELNGENGYLILEEDGSYSLYIDNQIFMNFGPEEGEQLIRDGFPVKNKPEEENP